MHWVRSIGWHAGCPKGQTFAASGHCIIRMGLDRKWPRHTETVRGLGRASENDGVTRAPTGERPPPSISENRLLTLQRQVGNRGGAGLFGQTRNRSLLLPSAGPRQGVQRQSGPEYVPNLGAPEAKPQPETAPEVLGRTDLDDVFRKNPLLVSRVQAVATELAIDPGLLAASLLAETSASTWSKTSGTVASEELGMDDWFAAEVKPQLQRIINAHPGLGLKFSDVQATGETWDTSTEKAGGAAKPRGQLDATKAVAAFAVYFKMQENLLRAAIKAKGKTTAAMTVRSLDELSPEQRFTVLRVGLNAGVGVAIKLFLSLAKGADIPRTGPTTRDTKHATRTAALHVARAIHLAQEIFGQPSSMYRPASVRITNEEAAMLFDRPELRDLPNRIVY